MIRREYRVTSGMRGYYTRGVAALFALLVLLGGGFLSGAQSRPAAVVAAPGSRDGQMPQTVVREPVAAMPAAAPVFAQPSAPAAVAPARPEPLVAPGAELVLGDYFVHIPPSINGRLKVLVALHGMGGSGHGFCESILSRVDREGWVVVAPTYAYGDWRDPNQVAREESSRGFIYRLNQFLQEELPARTGLDLDPHAAFYGFSRGAQLAQRYAMVYPMHTRGVVALSAGTYTLPFSQAEHNGSLVPLAYPFGLADVSERFGRPFDPTALQQVPFFVGVGNNDRNPADVPRQWDFLGDNRVARAETFARRMGEVGVPTQLHLFSSTDHGLTDEMQRLAMDFIAGLPSR